MLSCDRNHTTLLTCAEPQCQRMLSTGPAAKTTGQAQVEIFSLHSCWHGAVPALQARGGANLARGDHPGALAVRETEKRLGRLAVEAACASPRGNWRLGTMSRSTVVIDGLSYYVEHELMPVVLLLVK